MNNKYSLLKDLPLDIWNCIQDLLHRTDVENLLNTSEALWNCIFKDKSWLNLAKTYDRSAPLLIGHNLSTFRPRKPFNQLYLCLITHDHSGDLRYKKDEFFKSLQDGWIYNEHKQEISFPSGITVNVHDILVSNSEELFLPLAKLFPRKGKTLELEYCFHQDALFRTLEPPNIIGLNGPARKFKAVKYGCALRLLYQGKIRQYIIIPSEQSYSKHAWPNKYDESGLIASYKRGPEYRVRNRM